MRLTPEDHGRDARRDPALYDAVLVTLLDRARSGEPVMEDLAWYFTRTDPQLPPGPPTSGPGADRLHARVQEILSLAPVIPDSIPKATRYVLEHGYATSSWHEPTVTVDRRDDAQRLVRASYFFAGEQPHEEALVDGTPVEPLHAKTVERFHYGRRLLRRRLLWLPPGDLTLRLDGQDVPVTEEQRRPRPVPDSWRARLLRLAARAAGRYRDAWVLMDRVHDAADSGEILFEHLRRAHPAVNAWFVVQKDTPDWQRLRERHGDRLVAHGSLPWRLLMANSAHVISSHADDAITQPPAVLGFTNPRWRFTFLQHGVIKDDISAWLNRKPIETFVTSTRDEHASIAGDSAYTFSTREVQLTGMPRLDRLLEVGARFPAPARDLVLVAPTWRSGLAPEADAGTQHRSLDAALVSESEFMQQWRAFLAEPDLVAACRSHGVTLGFLPHPILQPVLHELGLPDHVRGLSYDDGDVQEYFARARVAVTDFSSIAFNEAYLDRPVVYFQFDEEQVLGGGHVGRGGYFDYRRDGFGPVCVTSSSAASAVVEALAHPSPVEPYASRITATFPPRDGGCSERVVQAILRSSGDRSGEAPVPTPRPGD